MGQWNGRDSSARRTESSVYQASASRVGNLDALLEDDSEGATCSWPQAAATGRRSDGTIVLAEAPEWLCG